MEHQRGQWGSRFGFLMAAVGSAVGLGNIWGFPYKMGANGGFAFLLIYLVFVAIVGFAVMVGELALGRKSGKGAIGAYMMLSKKFKWLGWLGVLSAFLIMTFYSVLGGYCMKYTLVNLTAMFGGQGMLGEELFTALITNQFESIMYTGIFMVLTCLIVMGGVAGGIEKFSKIAMPTLFVMLVIVIIRAVTLPGAEKGLEFMFKPNFEPFMNGGWISVLSTAGGQMFFSLSLGMGCIITYGSYLGKTENIETSAVIIPIADTIVALLAGLAVIPAAFALGGPNAAMAGPKLLFITLQNVFENMGAVGPFFGFLFYLLVAIAAITSAISLVEVQAAYFIDNAQAKGKKPNRTKITILVCVAIMALATIVAADGLGSNGLWQPMGFIWLDFMDLWSEGIMMPLGALLMSVFIGYELKMKNLEDEVLHGSSFKSRKFVEICLKYIVPVAMLFVLVGQLDSFFALNLFK